jgi:hypothetical protein
MATPDRAMLSSKNEDLGRNDTLKNNKILLVERRGGVYLLGGNESFSP